MKKDHRGNVVGPWAEEKLQTLERYLNAYTTALKKQPFKLTYIDAFAGSPVSRIRTKNDADAEPSAFFGDDETATEQKDFIVGSPLRALRCDPPFHRYYFFDLDETRVELLKSLEGSSAAVHVRVADCNGALRTLAGKFTAWNERGLAFLDPYGAHVEWATLQALAATGKIEVVINFPVAMAINRLIKRDGNIPATWTAQLDACFGTNEWRDVAFRQARDLFGASSVEKIDGTAGRLFDLYLSRLRDIFAYVGPAWEVRNTRNMPLYYLIWAGPNERGYSIARDVFDKAKHIAKERRPRPRTT